MAISISSILGVGLGLALIYYVLSLIVSSVTSQIAEWLNLRATDLETGLKELLNDPAILEGFKNHALVKNLMPMKTKLFGDKKVEEIPPETFALALFDVVAKGSKSVDETRTAINGLPDSDTKKALLGLIDSGVKEVKDARKLMEGWFDDKMTQISALYKQHAKHIAVIVALAVTLVTGVDTIAIAEHLWQVPKAQHAIEEKVDTFLAQEDPTFDELRGYLFELEELEIPILWADNPLNVLSLWKVVGLLITWVATAQGSSFWYQILKHIRGVTTGSKKTTKETGSTQT